MFRKIRKHRSIQKKSTTQAKSYISILMRRCATPSLSTAAPPRLRHLTPEPRDDEASDHLKQIHWCRIIRVLVIVKPAATLSSVQSRHHHSFQQRRRSKTLLLEFIKHDVGDVKRGVQPDEVAKSQRPHRMPA